MFFNNFNLNNNFQLNNFQNPSKIIDVLKKHKKPEQLLEKTDNIFSLTTLKSLTNSDSRKKSNKYLTLDIDPLVSSTEMVFSLFLTTPDIPNSVILKIHFTINAVFLLYFFKKNNVYKF